jgi:hypothetical protein
LLILKKKGCGKGISGITDELSQFIKRKIVFHGDELAGPMDFQKFFDGSVIGLFYIIGKVTGG